MWFSLFSTSKDLCGLVQIPWFLFPIVDESHNVRQGFLTMEGYEKVLDQLLASLKPVFICGFPRFMPQGSTSADPMAAGGLGLRQTTAVDVLACPRCMYQNA